MVIRGTGKVRKLYSGIRAKLAPGPTILLYHRVAELKTDPQLLSVTPDHFDEHISLLKQHYNVMSLNDLVEAVQKGKVNKNAIAITFDDGYADNYEKAWPILKKYSIPATIYVSTAYASTNHEYFCDELERLMFYRDSLPETIRLNISGQIFEWTNLSEGKKIILPNNKPWNVTDTSKPTPVQQAYIELHRLIHRLPNDIQQNSLDQIRKAFNDNGIGRSTHRAMSWDQIKELSQEGLIDIGAHTVNHVYLSSSTINDQWKEINGSIESIESNINKKVTSFAYPYGTKQSYTAETVEIVKEQKIINACSNFRGRIGQRIDVFQLPRFIVRDWDGSEFMRQIEAGRL